MPLQPHVKQIIERALDRNAGKSYTAAQMAETIAEAVDFYEDLMGAAILGPGTVTVGEAMRQPASQRPNILIQTPGPALPKVDLSKGVILGASAGIQELAPPAAVVRNPDGFVVQETEEETERKKVELRTRIGQVLHQTIIVDLGGEVGKVTLARFITNSPPLLNFVRVRYAQGLEELDGPQVQLSTTDINFDPAAVMEDIVKQAAMRYRKTRVKIEPRATPAPGMPDLDAMMRDPSSIPASNRTDDATSEEDAKDWNDRRSPFAAR